MALPSSHPLASFPQELIVSVLELLKTTDLHAVSLVCKFLHLIAESFLYSNIRLSWRQSRIPQMVLFLRSILRQPILASHVQSVALNGFHPGCMATWERDGVPKISLTEQESQEAITFVRKISPHIPYAKLWEQELRSGTMDAFLAVLLSRLPNLTHLNLDPYFASIMPITGMVLRSSLCDSKSVDHTLPTFQRLLTVSFIVWWESGGLKNSLDILPLFYLPNIQHLSVSIGSPAYFSWPAPWRPDGSNIRSLDLHYIRNGHLGQILSVTPKLEKLEWEWYYCEDSLDELLNPIINLDTIMQDLAHVKNTLTDLVIRESVDRDPPMWTGYPPTSIQGSLEGFANLEKH